MNHSRVLAVVSEYIREGDVDDAERALVALADHAGDQALAAIAETIPAPDFLAMARNFDPGRETQLFAVTSPGKFCEIIALEEHYGEDDHERLKGMVNGILFCNEDRIDEYLDALERHPDAVRALCDYFEDRYIEMEHMAIHGVIANEHFVREFQIIEIEELLQGNIDPADCAYLDHCDHEWQQLAWILRHRHTEIFADILTILRNWVSRNGDRIDGTGIAGPDETGHENEAQDDILEDEDSAL